MLIKSTVSSSHKIKQEIEKEGETSKIKWKMKMKTRSSNRNHRHLLQSNALGSSHGNGGFAISK